MPSYNNGQYIRQALDSILSQKVNFNYQIIITDDCSRDDSPQIIKGYEIKYPDKILALYSDENCGLFRNVLKAYKKMNSEYFCVLDPDDYWTDSKRLQKAVDFLDENRDYTIYATNLHKLYNDGSTEIKYYRPGMDTHTSTYEDFLNGKEVLSCTPSSTYRNVYFVDGIPSEYLALIGTKFEESFRADTARNLLHLINGKAFFVNESIGCCRYHGKGLASSKTEYERYALSALANIGYYEFFGEKNENEYVKKIKGLFKQAVKKYLLELANGGMPILSGDCREHFRIVMEWLQVHVIEDGYTRLPFSLNRLWDMSNKKVIIWGTGSGAQKIIELYNIPLHNDTFFVDNNSKKQGTHFMGREVNPPNMIREQKDALVVIASSWYKEIIKQIHDEKLCEDDRIVNLYDYKENWIESIE